MAVSGSIAMARVSLASPAAAVTSAAVVVASTVDASPAASVVTLRSRSVPAVAENVTRTAGSGFWAASNTVATSPDVPPPGGRLARWAPRRTAATAAAPMTTCTDALNASPE